MNGCPIPANICPPKTGQKLHSPTTRTHAPTIVNIEPIISPNHNPAVSRSQADGKAMGT